MNFDHMYKQHNSYCVKEMLFYYLSGAVVVNIWHTTLFGCEEDKCLIPSMDGYNYQERP